MMTRKIFWIILVIVMVCLNWFKQLGAQDLSSLGEAERKALLQRLSGTTGRAEQAEPYRSADIYDDSALVARLPEGGTSEPGSRPDRPQQTVAKDTPLDFDELQPFGTELFSGPRESDPPNDIAATDDYKLGPGDNVVVQLWGQVEKEYALTVDREGMVFIPQVGQVSAWGRPLGQFRQELERRLSEQYSDFDLNVSLGKIRSIRIYLTGEVRQPGAYTVSSLTSLFNALYLGGGPNENGSMRAIRLMRNGTPVAEVDLYRFLLQGDNGNDVRLETGDAIFVPVAGPRVAVRGKIRRPAIYEMTGTETVADLLTLAGNPTPDAYLSRIMLERVSGADDWAVYDLDLGDASGEGGATVIDDGDRLTLFSIYEMKKSMVAAFGLVKHPGYYERSDSTRVSDLIERAKLQPYDVHVERANLFRRHDDFRREVIAVDLDRILAGDEDADVVMQDGDSLHVYSIRDVSWDRYVFVDGRVKRPGQYQYYDNMTVEDAIFLAGSFSRGASLLRAEVARFDTLGEVNLLTINLGDPEARQIPLREDDRVYVRQIPQWQLHRTVTLEGEAMYPGEYVLSSREETLFQLIQRAGGLTRAAFPRGTIFERASVGEGLTRKQIPLLLEKSSPVVEDSLGNMNRQVLFEYEPASMNRIVLDVDKLLEAKGGQYDIVLQPGDRIFIPPVPSGISVLGAVGSSGTIKFRSGLTAKDYIKRAGNFSPQADEGGTRLIRANGEVYAGGGTSRKAVEPGDIIVVPTKVHREHNFGKTLTTTLSAVTGVLTTVLIIDRL
jgi:protein involved in polysaccharide export with SLBB domain